MTPAQDEEPTMKRTICPGRTPNPEGICPRCGRQVDMVFDKFNGDPHFATHIAN